MKLETAKAATGTATAKSDRFCISSKTLSRLRTGMFSQPVDYANVELMGGKFDLSWARLNEGDLEIGDAPIARANPEQVQAMMSAARERHQASNWLRGDARLYSNVGSDT